MTPSKYIKERTGGQWALSSVSEKTGINIQTLSNWHYNRIQLFDVIIDGCQYRDVSELKQKIAELSRMA